MENRSASDELQLLLQSAVRDINPDDVTSPAMRRLLEDVQCTESDEDRAEVDDGQSMTLYNRFHSRHNRSSARPSRPQQAADSAKEVG